MGGSNQGVAPPAATPKSAGGISPSGSGTAIRCHESNGEVHFHDDANNLKVAVPVANFHNMWRDLGKDEKSTPSYVDSKNSAKVTLSWASQPDGTKDLNITITTSFGDTYKMLEKIAKGSGIV